MAGPSRLRRKSSASLEYSRVTIASAPGTAANVSLCFLSASMHSQGSLAGTTKVIAMSPLLLAPDTGYPEAPNVRTVQAECEDRAYAHAVECVMELDDGV